MTKLSLPETLEQFTQREAALHANARKVAAVHEKRASAEARLRELAPLVKAARRTHRLWHLARSRSPTSKRKKPN